MNLSSVFLLEIASHDRDYVKDFLSKILCKNRDKD